MNIEANEFQTAYDYWYLVTHNLMQYGISMSYYDFDNGELYVIDMNSEMSYSNKMITFTINNKTYVTDIDELIICRLKPKSIMNLKDDTSLVLSPYVNLITQNIASFENMLLNNGSISGFIKLETNISNAQAASAEANWLKKQFSNAVGGFAFLQKGQEVHELSRKYDMIDKENIAWLEDTIYQAFGLNKNLFNSTYTEEEYMAFYRSTIKPILRIFTTAYNAYFYGEDKWIKGYSLNFNFPTRDISTIKNYATTIDKEIWNGIKSINQVILDNGGDPIDTPEAWEHFINKNVAKIKKSNSKNEDDEDDSE